MALTGKLEADFGSFVAEVNKAVVSLNGFEKESEDVAKSLSRMADRFSGQRIIEKGLEINRLFQTTGDLALLTEKELREVGNTAAEAADKMERLGLKVPANLKAIADTAGEASGQTNTLHSSFSQFDSLLSAVGLNIGQDVKALSEMTSAIGQTTSSLGLMATAGIAVGTGLAAYNLTRKTLEFLGLADGIDKAVAAMITFNALPAAEAGAKTDILAKASRDAGVTITDLTLAMKLNEETERKRLITLDTATKRQDAWNKEITELTLRGELAQFNEDLASQAYSLAELEKRYGLSAGALAQFKRGQDEAAEGFKAQAEERKKLSDQQMKDVEAYQKAIEAEAKTMEDFAIKTHGTAMKQEQEIKAERQKTLDATNAQVLAGFQQTQKLEAENLDFVRKATLSATDYKILKIDEWAKAEIAAFKGTEQELERFTEQVKVRANQQKSALEEVIPIVTLIGHSAAETEAARQGGAKQTGDVVTDEYRRQQEAFMQFKGVVVAGTNDIVSASYAVQTAMAGTDTVARDWAIQQAQRERGEIFLTGMSSARLSVQTRQQGGPVSAGQPYLVGERGAELFLPSRSGTIAPAGAGGITNVFNIVDTEAGIVRRVSDAITRSLKSSTKWGTV